MVLVSLSRMETGSRAGAQPANDASTSTVIESPSSALFNADHEAVPRLVPAGMFTKGATANRDGLLLVRGIRRGASAGRSRTKEAEAESPSRTVASPSHRSVATSSSMRPIERDTGLYPGAVTCSWAVTGPVSKESLATLRSVTNSEDPAGISKVSGRTNRLWSDTSRSVRLVGVGWARVIRIA